MSYCGKNCEECTYREELSCVGCTMGPGAAGGDCALAKCCREKGHESCETCGFKPDCGPLRFRHREPEERGRREAARQRDLSEIAQRLPILRRWLWVLFWMWIPAIIFGVIGGISQVIPVLEWPSNILGWLYSLAYAFILLKLSAAEKKYKKAGMFYLIEAAFEVALLFIPRYNDTATSLDVVIQDRPDQNIWYLLVKAVALIPGLLSVYYMYKAHSEAMAGIDNDLSQKWEKLWKWWVYGLVSVPVSSLLVCIYIGVLLLLADIIMFLVLAILQCVYLYRSARACRDTVVERIA